MSYRIIPISEAISGAQIALGMTSDDDRLKFRNWAYYACRTIGPSQTYINQTPDNAPIPIANFTFASPEDMQCPIDIIISKDDEKHKVRPFWNPNYWGLAVNDYENFPWQRDIQITFQGVNFIIGPDRMAENFTKAWVRYFAYPVDAQGEVMIPEVYLRAVEAYIEYMHHKSMYNREGRNYKMSFGDIQAMRRQWEVLLTAAKNEMQTVSKPEIDAAVANYITMLPNMTRLENRHRHNFILP
jgi:hypothetical protein